MHDPRMGPPDPPASVVAAWGVGGAGPGRPVRDSDFADAAPDRKSLEERVAKTLHQLYGPSEIQAWGDTNFDKGPWYGDARLVLRAAWGGVEPPAEAVEVFERVFYAEHPQDCVRPLSKALRAFLDAAGLASSSEDSRGAG